MSEEEMKKYIELWFEEGHTLKDLMNIVMTTIQNHEYIDH